MMFDFLIQAEDGIRDVQESRGLGDVYKSREAVNRLMHDSLYVGFRSLSAR